MSAVNKMFAFTVAAAFGLGGAVGAFALGTIEPGVIAFLNSGTVLHWAEVTLGV